MRLFRVTEKAPAKQKKKIIRDEKMRIIIETVISLVLMCTGYVGTCVYLKNGTIKKFNKSDIAIDSKSKVIYIVFAVLKSICIVALFNTIYVSHSIIHQLKLLVLIDSILPMAAVDYKKHKIPNPFLIVSLVLCMVLYIAELVFSPSTVLDSLKDGVIGAAVIGLFFLLISLVFKNSMGMGDIKLFALMSLYQGLWGAFNSVFFSLLVSFFLALGLLISKKKKRKDSISFGPSILLGTIIAIGLSGI